MSRIVMRVEVDFEVDLDTWGLTYGQDEAGAKRDAQDHVPYLVQGELEGRFEQIANGTTVTSVRLVSSGRHPEELTAEVLAKHPGNTVDYPFIRAWGQFMGSHPSYINEEVERARRAHAPADAIYHREGHPEDGGWHRFTGILNPRAISAIESYLDKQKGA